MNESEIKYLIALTQVEGVGPIIAKELLEFFGSAEALFKEDPRILCSLRKYGQKLSQAIQCRNAINRAEKELDYMVKEGISPLAITDQRYPNNLKNCADAPIVLFVKGNVKLNGHKSISIVGTRDATNYGLDYVELLIKELSRLDVVVHSGLAYGIDVAAHKAAIKHNLPTYCTLAHGFDRIYPNRHKGIANRILDQGGWISEFISGTIPTRENFPRRNRIVAGLSDATIVIESANRGGSLITANLANSYNRDVFALPGRRNDEKSAGCNFLIKSSRAHLMETPEDVLQLMGWEKSKPKVRQASLFSDLSNFEERVIKLLKKNSSASIDEVAAKLELPMSKVSTDLLMMEFNGLVRQLPGKHYELQ